MMQSVTQFGYFPGVASHSLGRFSSMAASCTTLSPADRTSRAKGAEVFNSLNVRWWALLPEIAIDIMNVPSSRVWNATLERYIARPVVFSEMTVVVDLPIPFGASDEQA